MSILKRFCIYFWKSLSRGGRVQLTGIGSPIFNSKILEICFNMWDDSKKDDDEGQLQRWKRQNENGSISPLSCTCALLLLLGNSIWGNGLRKCKFLQQWMGGGVVPDLVPTEYQQNVQSVVRCSFCPSWSHNKLWLNSEHCHWLSLAKKNSSSKGSPW